MDRKNRLKEAYKYLQSIGKIHTQKGFADALGKAEGTISRAFNGDEKALTDNLFVQITLSFPGLFNLDYLLTGEGSLLVEQNELPNSSSIDKNYKLKILESELEMLKRTNAALVATIESKDQVIATKDQLIDYLKQELYIRTNQSGLYVSETDLLNLKDNVSPSDK